MNERVDYDEFGLFHENAAEFGLAYDNPPTVTREAIPVGDGRELSALVWGDAEPELFLVHGGAQNAHTWDTVALALDRPLVAVDLPGHGHSDNAGVSEFDGTPAGHARDVAFALDLLAPEARTVVGMSLGGLTSIALAAQSPNLVRRLVLVDVTPGITGEKAKSISNFVNGPATFPSFQQLLDRTIEYNPTRSMSSLRRGILHNAVQIEDGSWVWRYRRDEDKIVAELADSKASAVPNHASLWSALETIDIPLLLVRGMRKQSVVDDGDVAELMRRCPSAEVVEVANAGHSVQGDAPLELAAIIADFTDRQKRDAISVGPTPD